MINEKDFKKLSYLKNKSGIECYRMDLDLKVFDTYIPVELFLTKYHGDKDNKYYYTIDIYQGYKKNLGDFFNSVFECGIDISERILKDYEQGYFEDIEQIENSMDVSGWDH